MSMSPASSSSPRSNCSLSWGSRRVSAMKSSPWTAKAPAAARRWSRTGRAVVVVVTGPVCPVPRRRGRGYAVAVTLRIRVDLSYDGTHFSGWAAQPGRRTVEGCLTEALTTMLRAAEPVRLTVAGRTDAGVHARGQVAHLDVDDDAWQRVSGRSGRTPEEAAATRLRGILPADIGIRAVSRAPEGFDARFSALRRRYLYRICDDPSLADPLRRHDTVALRGPLDVAAMDTRRRTAPRPARLRRVLPAARGRHDRAHPPALLLDPGRRRHGRGQRRGGRVLPQHGPRPRRCRRPGGGGPLRPTTSRCASSPPPSATPGSR